MSTQEMKQREPVYLKDYRPPAFLIKSIDLTFDLSEDSVAVRAVMVCSRNALRGFRQDAAFVLDGRELALKSVQLDGHLLTPAQYCADSETLTIFHVPERFTVEIATEIYPQRNTSLEGLYRSGGKFCTQCEAEGFRKITYFPDRPDVLALYTVTIRADKEKYPVLLSNGNLLGTAILPGNRHEAVWEDPFPKPSYLFALVAGNLLSLEDRFRTSSGREVLLQIYVEPHNRHKSGHAMESLKKAMCWDEETFGLEYDLDRFMIVAVDDFNMGAMENKGLNVFNSKYVLADRETATDSDFEHIEAVVAHEYFHNWTGNRVTCRDWFQLSLKEGLTVFRDQLFSAAMQAGPVKRIHDVMFLRNVQFPQDNSAVAHAVKPDSYIEINNFYTVTVYDKGAEVIRMLYVLLGREMFRKGLGHYLKSHDGRAATTDDFVQAMEEVSGRDLGQFKLWYSQAGTPELHILADYDAARQTCTLTVRQTCPATAGQEKKEPLHIPVALGFLDRAGKELGLQPAGGQGRPARELVLELRQAEETYCFVNVPARPVLSVLRDFSAPVKLHIAYDDEELRLLMSHDPDPFNRWEAWQRLAVGHCLALVAALQQGEELRLGADFIATIAGVLREPAETNKALLATLITLPTEEYLGEQLAVIDVDAVHLARQHARRELARHLRELWLETYHAHKSDTPYSYEPGLAGQRALKNRALSYLMALEEAELASLCLAQFHGSDNMTDQFSAFRSLVHSACPQKIEAVAHFHRQWHHDPLVLDKWFAVQASAPFPETLATVQALLSHPDFRIKNPNKVRALIGAFADNTHAFHDKSGAGYRFLGEQVRALDALNPQIAARLAGRFSRWRRYDGERQRLMQAELEHILAAPKLSRDVYEVAVKSLGRG